MVHRILVIRLGSLGDVILTSATVLNLKIAHPNCRLSFLTKARFAPIAKMLTGVDEVITLPETASNHDYFQLLLALDKQNFDLVVDLHGNLRSWLARRVISSGNTSAYPKRRLSRWLSVRHLTTPDDVPHTIDLYNRALSEFEITPYVSRPVIHREQLLPVSPDLASRTNLVAIAPGAAHATKQWPIERFQQVARLLIERHACHILWVAVGSDQLAPNTEASFGDSLTELIDWPLEQLAPLLARASVTISNDSGLMHLASAVGTPVIAIFGPTHSTLGFSPRGLHDQMIEVDEYCRPCSLHGNKPCFRTEQFCFTRITPETVAAAAGERLTTPLTKAVFFDRDGTLIYDKHYLSDPDQVELIPGAAEALRTAHQLGYKLVSLSNQSGVARGIFPVSAMRAVQKRFEDKLRSAGVTLDASATCPHYPFGIIPEYTCTCCCRKPHPGMAEQAARNHAINLHQSIVIGDKLDDLNLGMVIGASPLLVRTGHGKTTEQSLISGDLYTRIERFDSVVQAVASLQG
ncbi:MAG: HAD-IIIA family hydrolase [bacterium]|nr:HAD-IIIA family hydrolase [bacterium]